jgi:predicted phage baseplate assembly protein
MIPKAPMIDHRTEKDIFRTAASDLKERLEVTAEQDPFAHALLRVFARYCGLIIQRLNQVPDKNRMAFLDVLNVSRIPPLPAQVPLTFTPVKTLPVSVSGILVPSRTKVAASPGEGETEPAVFETMLELALTNIRLTKIVAVDSQADRYADKSFLAVVGEPGFDQFAFTADHPIEHSFYLGWAILGERDDITELRLQFEIEPGNASDCSRQALKWFIPTQNGEVLLTPVDDTTLGLNQSGEIVFRNLSQWPSNDLRGRNLPWLGCRLSDLLPTAGRDEQVPWLPLVRSVKIKAIWEVAGGLPEGAFFNNLPIDISKDFFPLGQRPQFGDLFYLSYDLFAAPQCELVLNIRMTNPVSGVINAPLSPVSREGDPDVRWEYWNGHHWAELICIDETKAFTENGRVSFITPSDSKRTTVNGLEGSWIRARLISGNYGHEERFEFDNTTQSFRHIPATLGPPCFQGITLTSSLTVGPHPPEVVVTDNHLAFKEIDGRASFQPFYGAPEPYKGLYLGFSVPECEQKVWADRGLDLYFHVSGTDGRAFVHDGAVQEQLTWQYWNGVTWIETGAKDRTESLKRSGMVSVRPGADSVTWEEVSIEGASGLYWLRLLWTGGRFACRPKLGRIILNTVPATQTMTLENELLGSSNGRPLQMFNTSRVPILKDVQLLVREPEMPSEEELARIHNQEGQDALDAVRNAQGEIEKVWIRWHEVEDFFSSGNRDRHFVVDRQSGEIRFGDGKKGMIPPSGLNNLVLRRYRTGGGAFGNKPAGSITQLRDSVPYVDSVVNLEPARGGQDVEDWESVRVRGSRWLRHRDRAVTLEDYEDLARLAAPDVAMAKCYPNRNLISPSKGSIFKSGVVSLIVVPRSSDPKPLPDLNLLLRVQEFINQRRIPDSELVVLAPEYVQVCVDAVVVPVKAHSSGDLLAQCRLALDRYLHPLTGGVDGNGWAFGEKPHESDLYGVLESIRGLEYVSALDLRLKEDSPDLLKKGIFLISSGEHTLRLGM